MKRSALVLALLLTIAAVIAQDFYTIQVRSLSRELPLTMEELQAGMWQHKVGGQTKCFMGRFETYDEAKSALSPLKNGKYSSAFVVSSDKIFAMTTGEQLNSDTVASKEEQILPIPDKAKVGTYTIQIAANRYPLYTKEFKLEKEVMAFYCNDNIYRYTVGRFDDEAKARELLAKVRESGYPDAFLIDYKKYEIYRIE